MIDDNELQVLITEPTTTTRWSDCLTYGDRAVVALPYLVMELPASEIKTDKFEGYWPGGHSNDVSKWRNLDFVPKGKGERAQIMRETIEGVEQVRLESPSDVVVYLHPVVYDFLCRQYFRPTFYVHPPAADGKPTAISVHEGTQLVAVAAPRVLELKDGWNAC